jgi:Zn-dependent peptidase ImmA (M78 family)/DNA-binding XRE family transcriptional regulator
MTAIARERVGRRIKWLRDARALTQDELAKRLGFKDRQILAHIEAGKRRIAPAELAAITEALAVEREELLDPFRLVGEGEFTVRAERAEHVDPAAVEAFVAQAGRWIATYHELGRQAGVAPVRLSQKLALTRESSPEDAADSAEAVRARWRLGDVPAETLERAAERELGALVLFVDAPAGVCAAASQLPGLQTVLLDRAAPASRRAFDLAHALFHLLTWDALPPARIVGLEPRRTKGNRAEQLANAFAAALLMPEATVRARWSARPERAARADADPCDRLADTARAFRVSPGELRCRLLRLGLLPKSEVSEVTDCLANDVARDVAPAPPLFSAAFVARVHEAVETGRLSSRRAAGLLGLPLDAFADLCRGYGLPPSRDAQRPRRLTVVAPNGHDA